MLARLQRFIVYVTLCSAAVWLFWALPSSPRLALLGMLWIAAVPALVLLLEFLAVPGLNVRDPAPRAGWWPTLCAWLGESTMVYRVFYWRQPFRSQTEPDHLPANNRTGVVFLHGFVCNRGFWAPWLRHLRRDDRACVAPDLEPVFGSIDDYVPLVEQAVQRVTAATGKPPVLICHSMGGLVARAWLRHSGGVDRIARVVTIGSPHSGTWLGRFATTQNGRQMNLASDWLLELARAEDPATRERFICWYSSTDNIVLPATTATLPGADNRLIHAAGHVELAFHPRVMRETLALLD